MSTHHRYRSDLVPVTEEHEERTLLNHEARQALSIILLTTEAFQHEIFGSVTEAQAEALAQIYKNTTRLQGIMENILQILINEQQERYQSN
jgi:hypothetical protein